MIFGINRQQRSLLLNFKSQNYFFSKTYMWRQYPRLAFCLLYKYFDLVEVQKSQDIGAKMNEYDESLGIKWPLPSDNRVYLNPRLTLVESNTTVSLPGKDLGELSHYSYEKFHFFLKPGNPYTGTVIQSLMAIRKHYPDLYNRTLEKINSEIQIIYAPRDLYGVESLNIIPFLSDPEWKVITKSLYIKNSNGTGPIQVVINDLDLMTEYRWSGRFTIGTAMYYYLTALYIQSNGQIMTNLESSDYYKSLFINFHNTFNHAHYSFRTPRTTEYSDDSFFDLQRIIVKYSTNVNYFHSGIDVVFNLPHLRANTLSDLQEFSRGTFTPDLDHTFDYIHFDRSASNTNGFSRFGRNDTYYWEYINYFKNNVANTEKPFLGPGFSINFSGSTYYFGNRRFYFGQQGTITLTFLPIFGYRTPDPVTLQLNKNEYRIININYDKITP